MARRVLVLSSVRAISEGVAHGLHRYLPRDVLAHGVPGDAQAFDDPGEHPTTLVYDGSRPGSIERLREIGRSLGTSSVVVYGLPNTADGVRCCAKHQVRGLVERDAPLSELAEAIEAVARGKHYTSPMLIPRLMELAAAAHAFDSDHVSRLTDRERQVATMLERGMTYAQIARDLTVSPATVKNHVHNIYRKSRDRNNGAPVGPLSRKGAEPQDWRSPATADRLRLVSDK